MENKIYQACREEAYQIIKSSMVHSLEELNQLTAELYAQKFIEWGSKSNLTTIHGAWCLNNKEIFGTTTQLHEKFVEKSCSPDKQGEQNKGGENDTV